MKHKKWFDYNETLPQILSLQISEILMTFSGCWFSKVFTPSKTIFKVDIKSIMLPQLISLWCLYYNVWARFYLLHVLEESEVVARKSSLKKLFLNKGFAEFTGQHHCRTLCCNKAASRRPATSLNTESGGGAFLENLQNLWQHLFCKRLRGPASEE